MTQSRNLAGTRSSFINLFKSMVGSGLPGFPYAIQSLGMIPGTSLAILAAMLSMLGVLLLVFSCDQVVAMGRHHFSKKVSSDDQDMDNSESPLIHGCPERETSYAALSMPTYPKALMLVELAVALKCTLSASSYLAQIVAHTPEILGKITEHTFYLDNSWICATLAVTLVMPVVLMHRMDSLKYTSFVGLMAIFYILLLSAYLSFVKGPIDTTPIPMVSTWSMDSLKHFSKFVFGLTCHQNVFPIYNEYKHNTPNRMWRFISAVYLAALTLYLSFTYLMANRFRGALAPDALVNFGKEKPVGVFLLARALFTCLMLVTIPLQTFPARNALVSLVNHFNPSPSNSPRRHLIVRVLCTLCIMSIVFVIAGSGVQMTTIQSIVGCTAGTVICYVLPATFAYKLFKSDSSFKGRLLRNLSILLFLFAIPASVVPLISLAISTPKSS